ncbi:MAG: MFS transporter, partial [Bacteroidota bacterium]|nr:MFS transporter [Bacteroidota bacterium]
ATTVGSIGGGFLSSYFIRRGWTVNKARKTAMLIIAFIVLPVVAARFATGISIIVTLISLAAAGHQAWSANIFTLVSDMFPKKDISSVVGIGSMAGSVGGFLFPMLIGYVLDAAIANGNKTAGYNFIFILCGVAYLLAWIIIQLLVPKLQKAKVD